MDLVKTNSKKSAASSTSKASLGRGRHCGSRSRFAAGDITVQSEIANSHIVCRGRLIVKKGPIFGGIVCANGGIACDVLGHPSGALTVVEAGNGIGCNSLLASASAQIQAKRKRARAREGKAAAFSKGSLTVAAHYSVQISPHSCWELRSGPVATGAGL
jgi:hypothetical protein